MNKKMTNSGITNKMTFGKVSTWIELSGDGKTERLIRETKGTIKADGFLSKSEIVKSWLK